MWFIRKIFSLPARAWAWISGGVLLAISFFKYTRYVEDVVIKDYQRISLKKRVKNNGIAKKVSDDINDDDDSELQSKIDSYK